MNVQTPVCELQLADVVQVLEGPWGTATVVQIKDNIIHLERPYGTTADFSYTGGVIAYVGLERFTMFADSKTTVTLWQRKELK